MCDKRDGAGGVVGGGRNGDREGGGWIGRGLGGDWEGIGG